jgi:SET domain-containing protein
VPEPVTGPRRHPGLEVRASEIAGRGWFAVEDLAAGTVVLQLEPGRREQVDGPVDGGGVDFPNHSCDPNLGWVDEVTLATRAEVSSGAELVIDYAMSITDPDWYLRCHCPSYRCRQMVEGSDWRITQLQARYAGWWAPSVRLLIDA